MSAEYLLKIVVSDDYSKASRRIRQMGKPIRMWRETTQVLTSDTLAAAQGNPEVAAIYGPYEIGKAPKIIAAAAAEKRIK